MKNLIGCILVIGGIILGLWLGVWFCFVGGIVQIINSVQVVPLNALGIGLGLLRFFSATLVGWGSFYLVTGTGVALLKN